MIVVPNRRAGFFQLQVQMSANVVVRSLVAAVVFTTRLAQGGDHAAWPTDWNNSMFLLSGSRWVIRATRELSGASGPGLRSGPHLRGSGLHLQHWQVRSDGRAVHRVSQRQGRTDTYGLYNADMWSEYGCKIQRGGTSGSYTYSVARTTRTGQ